MVTRIRGKALGLKIDGTDYWKEMSKVDLYHEEAQADVTTFEDAAKGGATDWKIDITALTATDQDAFWSMLWALTPGTEVPYMVSPHGNEDPTADKPHFIGTLIAGKKPRLTLNANTTSTFDYTFELAGEPVRDDGVADPGETP